MKITCTTQEYKVFQDINTVNKIDELKTLLLEMGVTDIDFTVVDSILGVDKITEWLNKAVGETFDGDGQNGAQCKDFANAYAKWLEHPLKPSNAAETWSIKQDDFWLKIPFKSGEKPNPGDIVIWDSWKQNEYGHIAVILDASADSFRSVDQNWKDSNLEAGSEASIITHNYTDPQILGYLRPNFGQ